MISLLVLHFQKKKNSILLLRKNKQQLKHLSSATRMGNLLGITWCFFGFPSYIFGMFFFFFSLKNQFYQPFHMLFPFFPRILECVVISGFSLGSCYGSQSWFLVSGYFQGIGAFIGQQYATILNFFQAVFFSLKLAIDGDIRLFLQLIAVG